ncbi:nucleotidyltransferase [Rhodococcus sp. YH3-3]|uniref:nucleotidyltransferase n=1 Tax=Rhodococcus sp. YH3-3 TaxID=1803579 RepID=UPI000B1CFCA6|nr:nucleotidyltransferase [Rhodococcus sp. YH3-3]
MTALEDKLNRYRQPSSNSEKDKQERAERMVKQAVDKWAEDYDKISFRYVSKGSYANNTNVRQDSDVDISVLRTDFHYFDTSALSAADAKTSDGVTYPMMGIAMRNSLAQSIKSRFGSDSDTTGSTAIELHENSGRVSADIVPSFSFRKYYYDALGNISYHGGQKVFKTDGTSVVNYPDQQLLNGRTKNVATGSLYKEMVRILKRAENDLVAAGTIEPLPSYLMECLMYNVPNSHFQSMNSNPLTDILTNAIAHIWSATNPDGEAINWYEPNGIKPLFKGKQKWTMDDANKLAFETFRLFNLRDAS